jgi:hypothetical protein
LIGVVLVILPQDQHLLARHAVHIAGGYRLHAQPGVRIEQGEALPCILLKPRCRTEEDANVRRRRRAEHRVVEAVAIDIGEQRSLVLPTGVDMRPVGPPERTGIEWFAGARENPRAAGCDYAVHRRLPFANREARWNIPREVVRYMGVDRR